VFTSNNSYKIYNAKIIAVKTKVQKSILLHEEDQALSPADIVNKVTHTRKAKTSAAAKTDILEYGKNHVAQLKEAGNIRNAIAYSCSLSKLKEYAKSEKLAFEDVTYSFIERFNTSIS
jgi:cellulase/cellobiase CelA1